MLQSFLGRIQQTSESHTSMIFSATPIATCSIGNRKTDAAVCNNSTACFPLAMIYCWNNLPGGFRQFLNRMGLREMPGYDNRTPHLLRFRLNYLVLDRRLLCYRDDLSGSLHRCSLWISSPWISGTRTTCHV